MNDRASECPILSLQMIEIQPPSQYYSSCKDRSLIFPSNVAIPTHVTGEMQRSIQFKWWNCLHTHQSTRLIRYGSCNPTSYIALPAEQASCRDFFGRVHWPVKFFFVFQMKRFLSHHQLHAWILLRTQHSRQLLRYQLPFPTSPRSPLTVKADPELFVSGLHRPVKVRS